MQQAIFERVYQLIINPLCPPVLGEFKKLGDTPRPPAKGLCPSALPLLMTAPLAQLGEAFVQFGQLVLAVAELLALFLHNGSRRFVNERIIC